MSHQPKSILFLSALDFKEKSIQVIRKTPEAFANDGWLVDYIVSRDNSKFATYYYEKIIDPDNMNVTRFNMPLTGVRNFLPNNILQVIATKLASYLTIVKLAIVASKVLKAKSFDVVYGYEIHGVMALRTLSFLGIIRKQKTVSRFQGTWITSYIKNKRYFKLLLNWEALCAMHFKSDLCIMTNDGTQGDYYFNRKKHIENFHFWINGVDNQILPYSAFAAIENQYKGDSKFLFVSICRLEPWKRVDRIIGVISELIHKHNFSDFKLLIVGEGPEKQNLKDLAVRLKVIDFIEFIGAVPQQEVKKYLNAADVFFSTYDLSNVGNPLLEAISANKIIFTLNNGSTHDWIQHKKNGFIYDIDENLVSKMSIDVVDILNNAEWRETIIKNINITKTQKLWDWNERFNAEVNEVEKLLN